MITTITNRLGRRGHAFAALVTKDGKVHFFNGTTIRQVCHSDFKGSRHEGSRVCNTYDIRHHAHTRVIDWQESWGSQVFPMDTWDKAFEWMQERAPEVDRLKFERAVRDYYPVVAERFDEVKEADCTYTAPIDPVARERAIESAVSELFDRLLASKAEVAKAKAKAAKAEERAHAAKLKEIQEQACRTEQEKRKELGNGFANLLTGIKFSKAA